MRYSAIASIALVAGASAWDNVTYTTEVVTSYTTYCPGPTSIVHGQKTYTVTEATVLTITDCPCTITKPVIPTLPPAVHYSSVPAVAVETPVYTSVAVAAETSAVVLPPKETPIYSVPVVAAPAPTASAPSVAPVSPTTPSAPIFTGAGNKAAASGLTLAGLAAVAAFFL